MALVRARFLVDKSALSRMVHEPVRSRLAPILEAGEAATCAIIELEVLYSARSFADYVEVKRRRSLAYHRLPLSEGVFERALEVQEELAKIGHHRLPIPDLIIAATAESAHLTLLHYDGDFETIAAVTDQSAEWVVERGSVP